MTPPANRHPRRRARARARTGMTLLEVVISVTIISVLAGAMMSVMLIASRSLNSAGGPSAKTADAADAAQQVTCDLSLAKQFLERTDRTIAFTVPDRDQDGRDETIRYAWSGTAGDPLTRQTNGGPVVTVAEDVHRFDLAYLLKGPG